MGKTYVVVTFGSRNLLELCVDDEPLDISAICDKPIPDWFVPSGGRDGWAGLLQEIQQFLVDDEAEMSFEFYGPQEYKTQFFECLEQHGVFAYEGGQTVIAAAPLDVIPVFCREGAKVLEAFA